MAFPCCCCRCSVQRGMTPEVHVAVVLLGPEGGSSPPVNPFATGIRAGFAGVTLGAGFLAG